MTNFDPGIVAIIVVAGVLGWPLNKAIKLLKDALRTKGMFIYVVEIFVCAAATSLYFGAVGWNWANFGIYTALVFASVHGFYVKTK